MNCRKLAVVRHGNTFLKGETPTRVGARTDLPLVEKDKSLAAAEFLRARRLVPDRILASPLARTRQTAEIIHNALGLSCAVETDEVLTEIDYGVDENMPEEEVVMRLGADHVPAGASVELVAQSGREVLERWDKFGEVPPGWIVDVDSIKESWRRIAASIKDDETLLVVSSNGIIRFLPSILRGGLDAFDAGSGIKVATGSVSMFEDCGEGWVCRAWNNKAVL